MARLFGTDGVRGLANREVTAELALDLSVAAAHVLAERGEFAGHRPKAVIGRDPRASGEFLEAAVAAGLASAGVDVVRLGVLPTPAVAYLTIALEADFGVMLSASHNPAEDNGIKFFARGGLKLDDEVEDAIEARLKEPWERPVGNGVGRITDLADGVERYVDYLVGTVPNRLDGLTVVLDAAHGAASVAAPAALRRLGAEVITIGDAPDGLNINDGCGSTHLDLLRAKVVEHGADVGVAHDGDADRMLAVDAAGEVVDGDQVMAILALTLRERGGLAADTVVATVMANLGFKIAMERAGLNVVQTAVGDRYVLEAMREGGYTLGGEQSGHIIMQQYATTGDGILAGLHLLARVAESGKPLAELAAVMRKLPQVMVNVRGVDKTRVGTSTELADAISAAELELGERGRVLLRPSGTEPLVRVMVEADTQEQADLVAHRLADVVSSALG
ncbi:phosphoglucosamine mutase [Actinospica sp. MGRD01-02]|uniref:Phosphoglucosamine mutase n=1 Tax=Actinospica acidithermotolerans TaxID=2828514 RepID=A0A941E6H4_9ACTN|nr:phosphoglucosamine mutase [Actinospica acidithermotolerans]MBR7825332.1 phosphoglucosamine mutase [Actinospica acidithermotolerans]